MSSSPVESLQGADCQHPIFLAIEIDTHLPTFLQKEDEILRFTLICTSF